MLRLSATVSTLIMLLIATLPVAQAASRTDDYIKTRALMRKQLQQDEAEQDKAKKKKQQQTEDESEADKDEEAEKEPKPSLYEVGQGEAVETDKPRRGDVGAVLRNWLPRTWGIDAKVRGDVDVSAGETWKRALKRWSKEDNWYVLIDWPSKLIQIRPQPEDKLMAYRDETLSAALRRWGDRTDHKLTYNANIDYRIQSGASFPGQFKAAAQKLASSLRQNGLPLDMTLFTGNKTLVVQQREAGNYAAE